MNLIRSLVTVLSFAAILFAAGTDSSSNGSNGGANQITGTVEQVSPSDSMLVIKSENKMDTVYITPETQFSTTLDQIKKGTEVMVKYEMMDNRKVATSVQAQSGSDGSTEPKDSTPKDSGM